MALIINPTITQHFKQHYVSDVIRLQNASVEQLYSDTRIVLEEVAPHQDLTISVGNTAPICRVPEEVLSEIFISCLPEDHFPDPSLSEAPLLFSHVCRDWRNVSVRTPHLWSTIRLWSDKVKFYRRLLPTWLSRSGALPISFEFNAHRQLYSASQEDYMEVIYTLTNYASRWRSVSLTTPGCFFPFPLIDNITRCFTRAPLLKSINIMAYDAQYLDLSGSALDMLSLSCRGQYTSFCFSKENISRVQHLTLDTAISMDDILFLLYKFPFLEHADFKINKSELAQLEGQIIQLTHLKSLTFRPQCSCERSFTEDTTWGRFFDRLHVPLLQTLKIDISHFAVGDLASNLKHVAQSLSRSQSPITSFEVSLKFETDKTLFMEGMIDCLKKMPDLRVLKLRIFPSASREDLDLAHELILNNDDRRLCPLLEELVLDGCTPYSKETLLDIITSRQKYSADNALQANQRFVEGQLRKFQVFTVKGDPFRNMSDFKGYLNEGLEFIVSERDEI